MSSSRRGDEKYMRDLQALIQAINKWLIAHPSAHVDIDFGESKAIVSGGLALGIDYWKTNGDARELIDAVDQATDHQCSMLQFRIAWKARGS